MAGIIRNRDNGITDKARATWFGYHTRSEPPKDILLPARGFDIDDELNIYTDDSWEPPVSDLGASDWLQEIGDAEQKHAEQVDADRLTRAERERRTEEARYQADMNRWRERGGHGHRPYHPGNVSLPSSLGEPPRYGEAPNFRSDSEALALDNAGSRRWAEQNNPEPYNAV